MSTPHARFVIVRDIAAPRDLVFRAWTHPELAGDWSATAAIAFREVVAPRRLVFTTGSGDEDPDHPAAPIAAVVFADRGDRTEVTFAASAPEERADALEEDWSVLFDRLAEGVAGAPG
jgi:uncharacterized protein YndB with AHSA1/START domain